jgi:hypothetical protein
MITSRRPLPPPPDPFEAARRADSLLEAVEAEKAGIALEDYRALSAADRARAKQAGLARAAEAASEVAGAAQVGVNVDHWRSMSTEERVSQAQHAQACATLRELCLCELDTAEEVEALLRDQPGAACVPNSQGSTALHLLCSNGALTLRALRAVLSAYPPAAAARNRFGNMPLHCLCENRKAPFEAVQLLLQANPSAATETNDGGVTPLESLRERRAPTASAWGVGPRPSTVPTVPTPPRERTPRTPADGSSPQRLAGLPRLRTVQSARASSSVAAAHRQLPRTPRSLRSQRSLQKLRTERNSTIDLRADSWPAARSMRAGDMDSCSELFGASAEGRGRTPRGASSHARTQSMQFRARRLVSTAPVGAVRARARVPTEEEDDELLSSFREKVMHEWVGMQIQEPEKYTSRSFSGIPAVGSSKAMHLQVDQKAHVESILRKKRLAEDPGVLRKKPLTPKMEDKEKQLGRMRLFQTAGHMAVTMGEYQARYTAVHGPVLMGDGNPLTGEQRSVVLVSKHEQKDEGRFDTATRRFLKVFITSKVLPEGTSLTKLDLPWIRNLFPGPFEIDMDAEGDVPSRVLIDAQNALMQQHINWLADLHKHGLYTRESLIALPEDSWVDQLAGIPPHAKETIKASLDAKTLLRPSEVFGLPAQSLPLEDASVRFQKNKHAPGYGTMVLQVSEGVHPDHPASGRALRFSSSLEPTPGDTDSPGNRERRGEQAAAEMKAWWGYIRTAQMHNLVNDAGDEGVVVKGVKYAVASMPGEEFGLRCKLTYATTSDFKRAFDGDRAVSNLCVWTYRQGFNKASGRWKKNVEEAVEDGQKLIVYSRRDWRNRRNVEDLEVAAHLNRSWPGLPIEEKKDHPIDEHGNAQEREIAWLKKQPWFEKQVEFRPIESLDVLRSKLGGGYTYLGQWDLDDEIHGHGKKTWPSGDTYEGDFVMGFEHGQGKKAYANGDVYDGGWQNGLHQGEGRTTLENGDYYDGSWEKGQKKGKGRMRSTRENSDVYEGECYNSMEHGKGVLTCANGNVFSGSWKKGEMHGDGTYTYANSDVVTGYFQQRKIKGKGEYVWLEHLYVATVGSSAAAAVSANATAEEAEEAAAAAAAAAAASTVRHVIVGEWNLESVAHASGRVEFESPAGDWYVGGWERGKRTPMTKGTMRETSVDRCAPHCTAPPCLALSRLHSVPSVPMGRPLFSCLTSDCFRHRCRDTKGNVYQGECENDSSGRSLAHGHGIMYYANGDTYVGEWAHGKREGFGTLTTARVKPDTEMRNKYVGTWAADQKHGAFARLPVCLSASARARSLAAPAHVVALYCFVRLIAQVAVTRKSGSHRAWMLRTA